MLLPLARFALMALCLLTPHCLPADDGFTPLFNGKDFTGWKVPDGDNGHWKVLNGVIDYDARSEAKGDKSLWTEKEYRNFTLKVDWRLKETPYKNPRVPIILPDGTHKLDENGKEIQMVVPDSDSGIFIRGSQKSQVNIWCWPIGSGEVYGYRMDAKMPPAVRAGVTPRINADRHIGQWNAFEITVKGDRLTVVLNGKAVIENAQLPGLPDKGPIGLQHHGATMKTLLAPVLATGKLGKAVETDLWTSPPSLVQFRGIEIKELD
jgi:hypothetical protein